MKIFVGAGMGEPRNQKLIDDAYHLGELLGLSGHHYIQGGYDKGLMGATFEGFSKLSDKVILVIPETYKKQLEKMSYKTSMVTKGVNMRLEWLRKKADIFIVLPGGNGTLDELFSATETKRSSEHSQEIILLNSQGFYDHLIKQLEIMNKEGLLSEEVLHMFHIAETPEETIKLVDQVAAEITRKRAMEKFKKTLK